MNGDDLLQRLVALANPVRLRVLAALHATDAVHVSELARRVGISRPLLIMHVKKLQAAGLLHSDMRLSADGKAMNMLSIIPFEIALDPAAIARAAETVTAPAKDRT